MCRFLEQCVLYFQDDLSRYPLCLFLLFEKNNKKRISPEASGLSGLHYDFYLLKEHEK
jgi:hypothetical protein